MESVTDVTEFDALPLSDSLLRNLREIGFERPTPIQSAFIPTAMRGVDLIGQARTGTGKTAAFMLPILDRIDAAHTDPQALILVPTRELAVQVMDEAFKLRGETAASIAAIYGGQELYKQVRQLNMGVQIVVGTPGRIIDMMQRGSLKLGGIRTVVLDEADRMLDIGFRPDIERILRRTPTERQTLLLSATMPEEVLQLAKRYMREPTTLNLSTDDISVSTITQKFITVSEDRKLALLLHLLVRERPRQCLIFRQMKSSVHRLAQQLQQKIRGVCEMSGDLPQSTRNRVMRGFRDGTIRILVATDVVGRGIDVQGISHVINYDIPEDPEAYVHRVGRTGRMGKDGVSFTFVTPEQGRLLTLVEMFIGKQIEADTVASFVAHEGLSASLSDEARSRLRRPVTTRREFVRRPGPPRRRRRSG